MRVIFLGVGEACDERYPNTSLLVSAKADRGVRTLLFDCGFTVPWEFWKQVSDPDLLDAVYVSHFHGDHFFGLPVLLLRLWEMRRRRELTLIGQNGLQAKVEAAMDLAYPKFRSKLEYSINYIEVEPFETVRALGLNWRCAESAHGKRNLSVRISAADGDLFYSGDGAPTAATEDLAAGCELVVHEAFAAKERMIVGHGTAKGSIEFARKVGAKRLALVHIQRDVRRQKLDEIIEMIEAADGIEVYMPEPGDRLEF